MSRRDHESALSWFAGRTVALWGCGALGSTVAEYLTRAGAAKLILQDWGIVAPGLLIRQLYEDADITEVKAEALARRLRRIREDLELESYSSDLLSAIPAGGRVVGGSRTLLLTLLHHGPCSRSWNSCGANPTSPALP